MLNGGFIQSKQVDKAVSFLNLKPLASYDVIKIDNVKTIPLFIYYAKLYMLQPFNKRSSLRN